jgi:general secretion pathway protein I
MVKLQQKHSRKSKVGLTLIEVLIALAIISIALTAVIKAVSENIRGTNYLQNKTMALWVGEEVMNEVRLGLLKLPGTSEQTTHHTLMLNRNWYWQAGQEETPNKSIRKIVVNVFGRDPEQDEDSTPIVKLESYVYKQE